MKPHEKNLCEVINVTKCGMCGSEVPDEVAERQKWVKCKLCDKRICPDCQGFTGDFCKEHVPKSAEEWRQLAKKLGLKV